MKMVRRSWCWVAGALMTGPGRWIEGDFITSAATFSAKIPESAARHPHRPQSNPFSLRCIPLLSIIIVVVVVVVVFNY